MNDVKKPQSGWMVALLSLSVLVCAAAFSPRAYANAGVKAMRGSAFEATAVLRDGLKDGASLEDASGAGFTGQQALMGQGAGSSAVCGGSCAAAAEKQAAETVPNLTAEEHSPSHLRPATDVPSPASREKAPGMLDKAAREAAGWFSRTQQKISQMSRGKKIAMLVGLMAVEGAIIAFPTQVLTVGVTVLGVLALYGTTRELIAMFRRRKA